jgi:TPP-dependent pyruvate/acetoin dehydrogenase alpha subunit
MQSSEIIEPKLRRMTLTNNDLVEMYRLMLLTRRFEERLLELCRVGRSCEGLQPSVGEEAVGVGACYGLRKDDYVLPTLRTREVFMVRGVSLRAQMAAAFGRTTSPTKGKTDAHHSGDLDKGVIWGTGIIGAQFPVADGVALVNKFRRKDNVVVCFFGDGASFEGEFHEGLAFAAVQNLGVVFVCDNNLYSASMPFSAASRAKTIAGHAAGYNISGVVVDGMDVMAVHKAVQKAVERARKGKGPSIVECKTYRFLVHFTRGDDGVTVGHREFRSQKEIEDWKKKDPIKRLETGLLKRRALSKERIAKIEQKIKEELDDAIDFSEKSPFPDGREALNDVYA